jgi:E3 ubiquitin-protein ligase RAD18
MEELVQAFIKARPEVLEYARKPDIVARSTSPKRSREEAQLEEDEGPRKRTRSSGRTQPKQRVVVLDSDLDDDDYVPGKAWVVEVPLVPY